MRHLLIIALIALAGLVSAQTPDKIDASRQFKTGDVRKYRLLAKIAVAQNVEIKGLVETKVAKEAREGAEVEFKCSEFSQSVNGTEGGDGGPAAGTTKIDRNNMPEALHVQNNGAVYVLVSVASYLPGKSLSTGEEFKIDWKGKQDGGVVSGKGKLVEIKTVDGIAIAVIKSTVQVTPENEHEPANLEIVSEFNIADGTLIKASGKGNIHEGAFSFTVDLVK